MLLEEFKNYATSELWFRSESKYTKNERIIKFTQKTSSEISSRLKKLRLSSKQFTDFLLKELEILGKGKHTLQLDKFLFSNPIIQDGISIANLDPKNLTFSELVYLSEEADRIYSIGKQGSFKPQTFQVINYNRSAIMGESEAMNECIKRLKEIGFSDEQINIFVENEKAIIQRVYDEKKLSEINITDEEERQ